VRVRFSLHGLEQGGEYRVEAELFIEGDLRDTAKVYYMPDGTGKQ